jgi:hypothetical protein
MSEKLKLIKCADVRSKEDRARAVAMAACEAEGFELWDVIRSPVANTRRNWCKIEDGLYELFDETLPFTDEQKEEAGYCATYYGGAIEMYGDENVRSLPPPQSVAAEFGFYDVDESLIAIMIRENPEDIIGRSHLTVV